jgi:hypothetical protein
MPRPKKSSPKPAIEPPRDASLPGLPAELRNNIYHMVAEDIDEVSFIARKIRFGPADAEDRLWDTVAKQVPSILSHVRSCVGSGRPLVRFHLDNNVMTSIDKVRQDLETPDRLRGPFLQLRGLLLGGSTSYMYRLTPHFTWWIVRGTVNSHMRKQNMSAIERKAAVSQALEKDARDALNAICNSFPTSDVGDSDGQYALVLFHLQTAENESVIRKAKKDKLRPKVRAELEKEIRDEVEIRVRKQLKLAAKPTEGTSKQTAKSGTREELKWEIKKELRKEISRDVEAEIRAQFAAEKEARRLQEKEKFRDELRQELKAELLAEIRADMRAEVEAELREQLGMK